MRHLLILTVSILLLPACNSTKNIKLYKLSVGMAKSEVERTLRKRPDNSICAKQYPQGHVEVIQYSRYELDAHFTPWLMEQYWLFFYNGRLVKWHPACGDCEVEADRTYEMAVANAGLGHRRPYPYPTPPAEIPSSQ